MSGKTTRPAWARIAAGFTLGLTIALSVYLLINASSANSGVFGAVWFLAVLPAFLSALICYIGDPEGKRGLTFYLLVPVVLAALVVLGSLFFLREGVICLLMLSPIWIGAGLIGSLVARHFTSKGRKKASKIDPNVFRTSLLTLPLLAGVVEARLPFPYDSVTVTRQVVIHASAQEVWPFAVSNAHIDAGEGRWNISQNIIGLPRPRATIMHGAGVGAVREACWDKGVRFDEIITDWQPARHLAWTFSFKDSSLQDVTDKHISPDGRFLKIDSGDYTIEPLSTGTTRLTLRTHYIAKSHVNAYAELWGEFLLGDIEANIVTIIKQRAEKAHAA